MEQVHQEKQTDPVVIRGWKADLFRGLIFFINVILGNLVVLVFFFLMAAASKSHDFWKIWEEALHFALLFHSLLLQGILLVVAGLFIALKKRPACWNMGIMTHLLAVQGYLLLIVLSFHSEKQHSLMYPDQVTIESYELTMVICMLLGVLAGIWLLLAGIMGVIRIYDLRAVACVTTKADS